MLRSGVELVFCPDLDHAQVFDSREYRGRVLEIVRRYCIGSANLRGPE